MVKDNITQDTYRKINEMEERIKVMTAFATGSLIQFQHISEYDNWKDILEPQWKWEEYRYRIAPVSKTRVIRIDELPPIFWVSKKMHIIPSWHLVTEISSTSLFIHSLRTREDIVPSITLEDSGFPVCKNNSSDWWWSVDRKEIRSFLVKDE